MQLAAYIARLRLPFFCFSAPLSRLLPSMIAILIDVDAGGFISLVRGFVKQSKINATTKTRSGALGGPLAERYIAVTSTTLAKAISRNHDFVMHHGGAVGAAKTSVLDYHPYLRYPR